MSQTSQLQGVQSISFDWWAVIRQVKNINYGTDYINQAIKAAFLFIPF